MSEQTPAELAAEEIVGLITGWNRIDGKGRNEREGKVAAIITRHLGDGRDKRLSEAMTRIMALIPERPKAITYEMGEHIIDLAQAETEALRDAERNTERNAKSE